MKKNIFKRRNKIAVFIFWGETIKFDGDLCADINYWENENILFLRFMKRFFDMFGFFIWLNLNELHHAGLILITLIYTCISRFIKLVI